MKIWYQPAAAGPNAVRPDDTAVIEVVEVNEARPQGECEHLGDVSQLVALRICLATA